MLKKINNALIVICLVGFISQLSLSIYVPSLPEMIKNLSASQQQGQMILTYYLLGYAIFQLIFGGISDQVGRRGCFVLGILLALIGVLFIILGSINLINVGRFIQGAGFGIVGVVSKAALRDKYVGKEYAKQTSYLLTIIFIAPAISPLLGAFIANLYNWEMIFIVLFILTLFAFFISVLFFPETKLQKINKDENNIKILFNIVHQHPEFWIYCCISGAVYAADICFDLTGAFILRDYYQMTLLQTGMSFIIPILGMILGTVIVSRTQLKLESLQEYSVSLMLLTSLILFASSYFFHISLPLFLLSLFIFMMSCGILYSTLAASALEPFTQCSGFASSIFGTIHFSIAGISSIMISYINANIHTIFLAMSLISSLCFVLLYTLKFLSIGNYNAKQSI